MALEIRGLAPYLQVYDMPTSLRFYRDILGFEVVRTSPNLGGPDRYHFALLCLGDTTLMLNDIYEFDDERPVPPDAGRVDGHSDVALYFDCPDVDAAYRAFTSKGLKIPEPAITRYGFKQICFRDPDGYGLNFHWPA